MADAFVNSRRSSSQGHCLRSKDVQRVCPKNWTDITPLAGLALETPVWLDTHGSRTRSRRSGRPGVWTDSRHDDGKFDEKIFGVAVTLACVKEGAATDPAFKVTEEEVDSRFAWQALVHSDACHIFESPCNGAANPLCAKMPKKRKACSTVSDSGSTVTDSDRQKALAEIIADDGPAGMDCGQKWSAVRREDLLSKSRSQPGKVIW